MHKRKKERVLMRCRNVGCSSYLLLMIGWYTRNNHNNVANGYPPNIWKFFYINNHSFDIFINCVCVCDEDDG